MRPYLKMAKFWNYVNAVVLHCVLRLVDIFQKLYLQFSLTVILIIMAYARGIRDGSGDKSTCCSCRGPEFSCQHPYQVTHNHL